MTNETWDIVGEVIERSTFYKIYGRKCGRTSGSSTYVYPITNWSPNKEIEIELSGDLRGVHSSAKKLVKELRKYITITDHHLCIWDGSCPNTYRIHYE